MWDDCHCCVYAQDKNNYYRIHKGSPAHMHLHVFVYTCVTKQLTKEDPNSVSLTS